MSHWTQGLIATLFAMTMTACTYTDTTEVPYYVDNEDTAADTDNDNGGDVETPSRDTSEEDVAVPEAEDDTASDRPVKTDDAEDDSNDDEGHTSIWCADADMDGYGNPSEAIAAESVTSGYVADCTDCNDASAAVHPGASDVSVNSIDEDCNGKDGTMSSTTKYTWYKDVDSDGYGGSTTTTTETNTAPSGYVSNTSDCNDADAAINPGKVEVTGNGKDDDCNSATSDTASSSTTRITWYVLGSPDSSSTSWNLSIANTSSSDWSQWYVSSTKTTGDIAKSFSGMVGDVVYVGGLYDGGYVVENTSAMVCQEHLSSVKFGTASPASTSYSVTTSTSGADCVCKSNETDGDHVQESGEGYNLVCTLK